MGLTLSFDLQGSTATLANYWAGRGWRVTIVTITGRDRDFYALDDKIKRITLNLDEDSFTSVQALINHFRRVRALRAVLQDEKPDVAVAMMATANALLALAGRGLTVPTIGSERIYPRAMPLGRSWEVIRRRSYPSLSRPDTTKRRLVQRNAPAPRVEWSGTPVISSNLQ